MNFQPKPDTQNAAPIAIDDVFSAHGNTPLVINVSQLTANDIDADGNELTVLSVDNASPGVTVSLDWNGNIVFTTDPDFSGPATFDYTIDDGHGGTSTAQVTVNVAPIQQASIEKSGAEIDVNSTTRGGQFQSSIAVLANGDMVVTWTDTSRTGGDFADAVRGQLLDANGNKIGGEFLVNTTINSNETAPQTTALAGGGFVVTWQDSAHGGDIRAQLFSADGARVGREFVVNTTTKGTQDAPVITALANGGFVVSWEDLNSTGGDIKARIFNANGVGGSEFVVNTTTAKGQFTPTIASLLNGGFVVSWEDDSGKTGDIAAVRAQLFDAGGNKVGSEIVVNAPTGSEQDAPTITALAGGGFVVAWNDFSGKVGDGDAGGIVAQIFNANGAKVGDQFLVNTTTTGTQLAPKITALSDGKFVVVWDSYDGVDGQGSPTLTGQVFDASGNKVGHEFQISPPESNQTFASIAALPDGRFVVSWSDSTGQGADSDGFGVKAQIFSVETNRAPTDEALTLDQAVLNNDGKLAENSAAGTAVGTVTGADPDGDILTYSLVNLDSNGQPITDGTGAFKIDARTGAITVANSDALDFESAASHQVRVTVTDPLGLSFEKTFTINLSDVNETPTITAFNFANGDTIPENSANGTVIGTVVATDPDAGDQLTFSLSNNANGAFAIDANGVVTVADSSKLDFETHPIQTIEVTVTDKGGLSEKRTITIDLSDVNEKPTITAFNFANGDTVPENSANGTVIGSVAATDPDAGDQLTYTLTNNANGAFAIDANGVVTVADSSKLDFETNPIQIIEVTVTDKNGLSDKRTITIDLSNVNEAPVASDLTLSTNEDTALTRTAAQLFEAGNVSDPDQGDTLTLTAVGNATHGTVSLVNGIVVFTPTANFSGVAGYDYTVTDAGGLAVTRHVTVDVSPVADTPVLLAGQVVAGHTNGVGQFKVNSDQSIGFKPSITQLADGGFLVTYNDTSRKGDDPTEGIRAQRFDANGHPVDVHGNPVSPTDPLHGQFLVNSTINRDQQNSSVTSLAGGGWVVVWEDQVTSSDSNVNAQVYDAAGNKVGGQFLVNRVTDGAQDNRSVAALGNGNFVVTWDDTSASSDGSASGIKARIFDASGNPVGDEFVVNSVTAGNQQFPTVAALASSSLLPQGGFIETWFDASTNAVKAKIFDLNGNTVKDEFTVSNNQGGGQQIGSVVVQLANGNILVAWRDASGNDGDPSGGLDGQILSPDGSRIGGEFLINTAQPGVQKQLTITALANGDFVAVWTDPSGVGGDTSADAIKAQVFSANGVKLGGEILVNTLTAGDQINPVVTAVGPDGFIIAWTDNGGNNGGGVQAQRFNVLSTGFNTAQQISIAATSTDTDGSETLTTVVSGIPAGAILSDGHGHSSAPGATSVDVSSWNLASLTILPPPDFIGTFQLTVTTTATDSAILSDGHTHTSTNLAQATQTFNVTVTDDKPTIAAFNFANSDTIPENSANGTVIGSVVASDPNVGDQLTYTLTNNANGAFAIDANGVVKVADSTKLDFETHPVQTIEVTVTDKGGLTDKRTITIDLSNVNEAPVASDLTLSTNEDTALTRTAAQLLAAGNVSDPDAGDTVMLTAVTNATHGTVSLVNGSVVFTPVANFSGVAGFDYTVTDAGGFAVTRHVTVDVAPVADTPALLAGQVVAGHANGQGQFKVNSDQSIGFRPSITQLADGGFLVTYNDTIRRGDDPTEAIRGQRFDASGHAVDVHGNPVSPTDPLHGQFLVNSTLNRDQQNSKVTSLVGGGWVVVWEDSVTSSDMNVRAQVYDASGNKVGGEIPVNQVTDGTQDNRAVAALPNGGFVVTWDDNSASSDGSGIAVKARIFDASGNPAGDEFVVESTKTGDQQFPTVTALAPNSFLPQGGFIETWFDSSTNAVKAKIFDLNGNTVKDEFLVSTHQTNGQQTAPVDTQLANGNFVIAWRDASGLDGDPSGGPEGQVFSPDGTKIGGEFLINTALPGVQIQLTITALANGDFVAVWTDPSKVGGDTSEDAIKAQLFSSNGVKVGGEILVNTLTAGDQINPAVTAFGQNGFIIAWTDNGGNNGGGVQAQIFTLLNTDENTAQQLNISAVPTDADGSETLTTVISGIPAGAILSDGHGNSSVVGATSVDVSKWNLASLTILPPQDFIGNFQLTVATTSTDSAVLSDGQTHTSTNQTTQTFNVIVTPPGTSSDAHVIGTAGNNTFQGGAGNDVFMGGRGNDTLISGGGNDTFVFDRGDGQDQIINGVGQAPRGELDFGAGISDEQLWFNQNVNDLTIQVMGSQDRVTISGWFDPTTTELSDIAAGGLKLNHSAVAQLVQAMSTFSANNPAFDPVTATQAPNDAGLQNTITTSWHA